MRPLGIRKVAGITAAAVALSTLGGFAELTGETGRAEAAAAQAVAAPAVGPSLAAHAAPSVVVAPADWAARDGRETRDAPQAISASRLAARRDPAVTVMPAHGLCLERVTYPEPELLAARAAQARAVRTID